MTTTPWVRATGHLAARVLLAGARAAVAALRDELDRLTTQVTQ